MTVPPGSLLDRATHSGVLSVVPTTDQQPNTAAAPSTSHTDAGASVTLTGSPSSRPVAGQPRTTSHLLTSSDRALGRMRGFGGDGLRPLTGLCQCCPRVTYNRKRTMSDTFKVITEGLWCSRCRHGIHVDQIARRLPTTGTRQRLVHHLDDDCTKRTNRERKLARRAARAERDEA